MHGFKVVVRTMKSPNSDPQSLFDVWNLYYLEVQKTQQKQKAAVTISLVKTAIIRYTLPGWGLEPSKHKRLTAWESYRGLTFMKEVELPELARALDVQQQVFEQQEIPLDVQRNYRAALNRFLQWCQEQPWWHSQKQAQPAQKRSSPTPQKRERARSQRPKYALGSVKGDFISEKLQSELEAFQNFRLNQNRVRQSTLNKDLRQIRLVLGWLHRFKNVSLESLSLQHMVPLITIDSSAPAQREVAESTAFKTLDLINEYIHWLESFGEESRDLSNNPKSFYTSMDALRVFLIVAQFIYRDRAQSQPQSVAINRYQDVPIVQLLRQELADVQSAMKKQRSTQYKEIPEWTEFLAIVEQMRQQCEVELVHTFPSTRSDTNPSPQRALAAIAYNYQCFLFAALLCYLPPQRQQVWRNLKLFEGLRIEDAEIEANSELEVSGYLYKQNEQWWLHLLKDNYKTSKTYQNLRIKVPNIQYQNSRCFYQYLDEWLIEFKYNTVRGIERINGLRQVFSPQHEYIFTQRNGKRFTHASNFNKLLQSSSYGTLGESLTPELLRYMFVRYVSKQHFDETELESLASAMGHSLEKQRETYDIWLESKSIQQGVEIAERMAQEFIHQ